MLTTTPTVPTFHLNYLHTCIKQLLMHVCIYIVVILAYLKQLLTLKVLVTTIDAQWEGMGDVGSARYEPALLPPCPTIRVLSYSN